jgi:type IV pilus assembly protein PilB
MATEQTQIEPAGLARRLIGDNLLTEKQARDAQAEAARKRTPFIEYLVSEKIVSGRDVALSASEELGVPLLDLDAVDLSNLPFSLVDEKLLRKHRALPIHRRGNRLFLAVSDPTNDRALEEIRFNTGMATDAILVEEEKLAKAIEQVLEAHDTTMSDLLDADLDNIDIAGEDDDQAAGSDLNVDDAPVVRYVNKILIDAIKSGASDIHFEPYEKYFRIRFRQDGMLREIANPPLTISSRLIARLKVMSRMNIAERRIPQDGRIKLKLSRTRCCGSSTRASPTSASISSAWTKSRKRSFCAASGSPTAWFWSPVRRARARP